MGVGFASCQKFSPFSLDLSSTSDKSLNLFVLVFLCQSVPHYLLNKDVWGRGDAPTNYVELCEMHE